MTVKQLIRKLEHPPCERIAAVRIEFADVLREHKIALALTDTSFVPRPWGMKEKLDLITSDFAYVRWLGDRKKIEEQTTTWDKVVVERTDDLRNWVDLLKTMVNYKKNRKLFAYANNHYALCRCRAGTLPTTNQSWPEVR